MYQIKLSPYHKIFYSEWKLAPCSSKYNIVFDQILSSNLDISRLKDALHQLVSDYLIINSHIKYINDDLYWVKNLEIAELEYFEGGYTREQIWQYVSKPFELETKNLYRFAIFTEPDKNYRFILVLHHLLIDASASDLLMSEISNYYNIPTYKTTYSLVQQQNILMNNTLLFDGQLEPFRNTYQHFWADQLLNVESIDLRWAKSKNASGSINEHRFNFTQEITTNLISAARKLGITPYIYSQCVFAILLYKYTGQNKFGLSYPISIKGGTPLISGVCVNTNISIYEFNTTTKIIDLLKQSKNFIQLVKATGKNAGYYPINNIISSKNARLLEVMFAQTKLKDTAFNFAKTATLKINSEFNIELPSKILFELEIKENILNFRALYNLSEIDESILTNFIHQYKLMLLTILNDLKMNITDKSVSEYPVLNEFEYNKIIYEWNKTRLPCNSNKLIHELFEYQVDQTPNNIAIVYENIKLTYLELNQKANQLAHYLKTTYTIKGDDLIALYLNRNQYMIIAILGILKAGGAYVPIDLKYPEKRITYILEDIKAKLIITNNCYHENFSKYMFQHSTDILTIDNCDIKRKLKQLEIKNPKLNITGSNLVYIMYTSGTTGNPKGVMVEHFGVTIRILAMIKKSGLNSRSRYLFKTNYNFDVSFSDIFMTLLSGASLYITKSIFDVAEINNLITKNNITACHFVPSQLELMHDVYDKRNIFKKLKIINISGEKFKKSLIHKTTEEIKYINYYGPTETGEVSYDITYTKDQLITHRTLTTIGYPLNQSTLYILDKHLKPLPIGAIGELYIGGAGLARGYLNLPQLTNEQFISNPFQNKKEKKLNKNNRLYKTGDLVRYLPDRNIEYIGRKDNQIKINGLRIELDEIEAKLSNYPRIKQVVVLCQEQTSPKGNNEPFIAAYYMSEAKLDEDLIFTYLSQELPEYMIPNKIIWLDKLPLTRNGKLDINSLPKVCFTSDTNNYVAPNNKSEQKICTIFADVLGLPIEQVGINDSFFKLGGNSISAIRLTFKLQTYFSITVNNVFEFKTPAKIAQFVPDNNITLIDKLKQIKCIYLKLEHEKKANNLAISKKHTLYKKQVKSFKFDNKSRCDSKILLTGATGYLGCHLLYQILHTTNHMIYIPIRANSIESAYTKLSNKFKYYFNVNLVNFSNRIIVFVSDLSKTNMGLDNYTYEQLVKNIGSIIHSAAQVKFYGNSTEFYLQNVQSTINLLELAKSTSKDFHYISTIGVFKNTCMSEYSYNIFTENSIDNFHANLDNIYTKTKYESEQATLKYREYGVKTNIYRIGNLAINSITYKTQENIEDNAFFQCTQTMLKLGIIPQELSEVEISPVDATATSILALFNQIKLYNQIYHIFNPHQSNLYKLFNKEKIVNIKKVTFSTFIDDIVTKLKNGNDINQIELFTLHQGWLQPNISHLAKTIIFQDKTNYILNQLKFKWPSITNKMLLNMFKEC